MALRRGGLSRAQVARFHADGYVVVENVLSPDRLEPLRHEIAGLVDAAARQLAADGRIQHLHEDEAFEARLTRLLADHPELARDYLRAIEGKGGGGHAGPAMFALITDAGVLDVVESLVGPEIVGSSAYRIRPKVPGLERGVVPWHQDSGYFAAHCDRSLIVTCWIPLVDATPANGCLQVLPRVHTGPVVRHHAGGPGGYLVIEECDLPRPSAEAVAVPVRAGGMLVMTNRTPHCSTPNTTDTIRWSVDLRYQGRQVPTNALLEPEEARSDSGPETVACYAPEADFVVRSRRDPGSVHTYEQFARRRACYEAAALPGPDRGWTALAV